MRTIKIGIFGLGRGSAFYESIMLNNGEIVAVCETNPQKIAKAKEKLGADLVVYDSFDAFIAHPGMEAVFLSNYFHEHAPYAIRALEKNIHVLSECTSNGTMAEGVALVRAAEKSKAFYMLAENYPFMKFNQEMRRVYQGGSLGRVLFAEGEYNHPLNPQDPKAEKYLRPHAKHWRNHLPRTYYITHSLAPLMYITGAIPRRVTAFSCFAPYPEDSRDAKYRNGDRAAIVTCLNDDDSVYRVTGCAGFGAHENSYRVCAEKGQIENLRGSGGKVLLRYNAWDKPEGSEAEHCYMPEWNEGDAALIEKTGHGGGDFFVIREFFQCIREGKQPTFDAYFATTCASVAILAHRSILAGGMPFDVPDFRLEEDRKRFEKDHETPFYGSDGSLPTIPVCSKPETAPSIEQIEAFYASWTDGE